MNQNKQNRYYCLQFPDSVRICYIQQSTETPEIRGSSHFSHLCRVFTVFNCDIHVSMSSDEVVWVTTTYWDIFQHNRNTS